MIDKKETIHVLDQVITCFPQRILSSLIFEYLDLPPVEFQDDYKDNFVSISRYEVHVLQYSGPWLVIPTKKPLSLSSHSWTFVNKNKAPWNVSLQQHFEINTTENMLQKGTPRHLVRQIHWTDPLYIHIYINLKRHSIVTIFANNSSEWFADEIMYESFGFDDQQILSFAPCVQVGFFPQNVEIIPQLPFKFAKLTNLYVPPMNTSWHDAKNYCSRLFISNFEELTSMFGINDISTNPNGF
jgi:hypothetical protein